MTVNGSGTVRFLESVVVPTLDGAGKSLTFAGAANIYYVAGSKEIRLDYVAYVKSRDVLKPEFLEGLLKSDVRLLEVTRKRLLEALGGSVSEAELDRKSVV